MIDRYWNPVTVLEGFEDDEEGPFTFLSTEWGVHNIPKLYYMFPFLS